ncbi:MAG: homoserine dehydrogenase [Anaerolineales bacterium]|nr:homoserine dehydrogenase [Chloroflexota bacterium]MBL6980984.1 homoserine dehydrogenase [Anaerolineales bacterium]
MSNYLVKLSRLEKNIRVGIVGIGSIGKGMVLQAQQTPGIECVAISDIILERAISWAEELGEAYEVVDSLSAMNEAIRNNKMAVCQDGNLVAQCELMDVFMEASSSIHAGGQFGLTAIKHEKHLIMMNYEADLMFGPYLMRLAEEKGLVYSVCDGDQPTAIKHIVDELKFMGFKLVMAGNNKGYLDQYTNPTLIIPEADKRDLDYKMCSSYTDGSKMQIENAVVANGLGLRTDVTGMHGHRVDHLENIFDHFDFEAIWDGEHAVTDYVLGSHPKGSIFAIGYADHPHHQKTLAWIPPVMGPGPFYLFYKPYFLGHFESMKTVALAVLAGEAILKPDYGFKTNVYAYAKKDLKAGDVLDGMGGYACYGLLENCDENEIEPGIPICLAENVTLKRDISKDEKVFLADVEYDANEFAFDLYFKAMEYSKKYALSS